MQSFLPLDSSLGQRLAVVPGQLTGQVNTLLAIGCRFRTISEASLQLLEISCSFVDLVASCSSIHALPKLRKDILLFQNMNDELRIVIPATILPVSSAHSHLPCTEVRHGKAEPDYLVVSAGSDHIVANCFQGCRGHGHFVVVGAAAHGKHSHVRLPRRSDGLLATHSHTEAHARRVAVFEPVYVVAGIRQRGRPPRHMLNIFIGAGVVVAVTAAVAAAPATVVASLSCATRTARFVSSTYFRWSIYR